MTLLVLVGESASFVRVVLKVLSGHAVILKVVFWPGLTRPTSVLSIQMVSFILERSLVSMNSSGDCSEDVMVWFGLTSWFITMLLIGEMIMVVLSWV